MMLNKIKLHFNQLQQITFFQICIFLSIISFGLLNGCSTSRRDGPPSYDVDVSRIPDAVPKVEKLSRSGNKPYTVFGKRYYVMSSSKNYEQRGTASWYGTKFHGHYASNGERYNMLAMTAAHKTLPLPTYVQVTNLKNGRRVIVKVTDRGPFESNRLIDLSYAAAKKLGMLGHGTAPVDVKAIDPLEYDRNNRSFDPLFLARNSEPHTTTVQHSNRILASSSQFRRMNHHVIHPTYIRVGAFRNRIYAENMKKRLTPVIGSPVSITRLAHLNNLYRVQIGPVHDPVRVAQINRQLRSMGIKSLV